MTRARLLGIAVVVFVLLAGFGLTAALAQGGDAPPAGEGITPNTPEVEPNDTFWEANYAYLNKLYHGAVSPAGDVDYYLFFPEQGMPLAASIDMPTTSPLLPVLSLYDENEQLLAQATCGGPGVCLTYTTPDWGYYYLAVEDAAGAGGRKYQYKVELGIVDAFEPNDFMEQASLIAYGDTIWAEFEPAGDVDFFAFDGELGDKVLVSELDGYALVFDEDGNQVVGQEVNGGIVHFLPATGRYYLQVATDYCSACYYHFSFGLLNLPVYLSLNGNGVVGGVPFTSGDVLLYWMGAKTWQMYFDASDVGLKGNLVALDFGDSLRLVYNKSQNVPGLGQIGPNDILSFQAYRYGEDTAGYLGWYFDGSDVGLSKAGEGIDALGTQYYQNYLVISTAGTARVPYGAGELRVAKDDLLGFAGGYLGANTTGLWEPFGDGFSLDVGAANLWGLDLEGDQLYMSFDRRVVLDGVVLDAGDIALCRLEWYASGCASVQKYFDASDAGLRAYKVDAFDVGNPPQAYP